MIPRIVITGAPSSGKTEFFERLESHPAFSGFLFFDELARQLLTENPHYRNNWSKFHIELYHRQEVREKQARDRPFITDRGTADAFAFHSAAMSEVGTTLEKEHQKYSAVVQLGTSAILGERFYQRDSIRNEPVAKALAIEEEIKKVWCRHPGYHFVEAEIDFEKKFRNFLQLVLRLIRIDG
jgi:predicted ATPase